MQTREEAQTVSEHEDHIIINKHNVMTYVVDGKCFTTCTELRWYLKDICGFNTAEQVEYLRGLKKIYAQGHPYSNFRVGSA